ncbi:hypothetical protein NM688_g6237 [Phlebia brevispora]|uniref:Uncharacterized protein n=1 Tax=Phlebia brevispora TaxID=194682 RepID=A0ACC1SIB7_9APHY|nr:hypothetical protein NM688_g6237 [Phlebia brevispora]
MNRLARFAENPTEWYSMFQRRVDRQRGSMTGKRAQSRTAKRIVKQFPPAQVEVEGFRSMRGKAQRPIKELSDGQIAEIDAWAKDVLITARDVPGPVRSVYGLDDPVVTRRTEYERLEGLVLSTKDGQGELREMIRAMSFLSPTAPHEPVFEGIPWDVDPRPPSDMLSPIFTVPHLPFGPVARPSGTAPIVITASEMTPGFAVPQQLSMSTAATHNMQAVHGTQPAWATPEGPGPSPSLNMDILILPDGSEIIYDKTLVTSMPNPPSMHFSKNLPSLMLHWNESTLLSINGQGIPVKFWDFVYSVRDCKLATVTDFHQSAHIQRLSA